MPVGGSLRKNKIFSQYIYSSAIKLKTIFFKIRQQ